MGCPYKQATRDALRLMGLDASHARVVAYGIHAGFPQCCIFFYCRIWTRWSGPIPALYEAANHDPDEAMRKKLWEAEPAFMRAAEKQFRYLDEADSFKAGYVRCPWCVINDHRATVRDVDTTACTCWLR